MSALNNGALNSSATSCTQSTDAVRVHLLTMGCAKNEVDSAEMSERLSQAGYVITDDPSTADAIIVNTCSFIQAATEESIDAIFQMAGLENVEAGSTELIVAGCMPARYGDDLSQSLEEVKCFVPCSKEQDIVEVMDGLFPERAHEGDSARAASAASAEAFGAQCVQPSVYVKISDGCDRFCSYCTIPFIRGRYHSFPEADIARDVDKAIASGAGEIVFIAQDTGRWGSDFSEPSCLADLMAHQAIAHPDTWFRVMYLQPEGISDALLRTMAAYPNICSYLDIPLQHASEHIIADMNRKGSGKEYVELLDHIRQMVPDITLRTTLITGFPGETEKDFDELCDFLNVAEFDYVGVFPYSCEDGTRAANLPDQVDDEVKLERAQAVRDIGDAISTARIAQRVGTSLDVLVIGTEEDGQLFGRAQCQAPDVDGVTYIPSGTIGKKTHVRIIDSLLYEMEGE